jgi:hypothetical protein
MEITEDFGDVCREGGAGCGRGRKFFADDPGLKFWRIHGGRPAIVLYPVTLHCCVSVAFVFLAEESFLPREPLRIVDDARFCD